MALTPQNNDAFVREVDEELRREQLTGFWKKYGRVLAVLVIAGLLAFGGYLWWQHQQAEKAGVEGEQLAEALDKLARNDPDGAKAGLEKLTTSDAPGYRAAAKLAIAAIAMQKDDLKASAAGFKAVADDSTLGQPYRDLALVRQTAASFDSLPPDTVIAQLKPLAVPGNPWFGSAGEMVAIAHLNAGRPQEAGRLFAAIGNDTGVPQTIRSRAVQMASILGIDPNDPKSNESAVK